MSNITRRALLSGLGMTALSLVACGSSSGDATDAATAAIFRIGVLQLVEHEALNASYSGFVAALDEASLAYRIDQRNAQGDLSTCQTIAAKLADDGYDLILAIATPAVEAVARATTKIPIVGTAVTDFAASGLVASNDEPGGNITGSSDLTPVTEQIELLGKLLPEAKTVGVLYCSAESNSEIQVAMAEEACAAVNLTAIRFSVSDSNEIQQVIESAAGKVDALYCPTDNTIATNMTTVATVANENNLPTICGAVSMVNAGGLASYSVDYYELGKRAGAMAVRILTEGANPATMPIEYLAADECELVINKETAAALGIDASALA